MRVDDRVATDDLPEENELPDRRRPTLVLKMEVELLPEWAPCPDRQEVRPVAVLPEDACRMAMALKT